MALVLFVIAILAYLVLHQMYQPSAGQQRQPKGSRRRENKFKETSIFEKLGLTFNQCPTFMSFVDRFNTFEQVVEAIKMAGLERSEIIIGIDFSASNEWQGRRVFASRCLHDIMNSRTFNPYQRVLTIVGATLERFDSDHLIPVYGFGDVDTKDKSVFSLKPDDEPCYGFIEVLQCYNRVCQDIQRSGPTSLEPIIKKAIEVVKEKPTYHLLLILTDGQLKDSDGNASAIIEASNYPISIVVIGIGDGPWDAMEHYDDNLPSRKFDNFQFVNFHQVCSKAKYAEAAFALHVLMEIPDQYKAICELGYLRNQPSIESWGMIPPKKISLEDDPGFRRSRSEQDVMSVNPEIVPVLSRKSSKRMKSSMRYKSTKR
ncbi:E3 ubiquitin-protein ligase RGLG5-like [Patiria miniata]|uniref:VWFA domain-containing protein n=1 Tax=Patiria miniata TaxID=46514 RepID=A0A914A6Q8_PATMI|nr:E3 ubiquitin-protein ligase RGLG5-like [Patiria miniata]